MPLPSLRTLLLFDAATCLLMGVALLALTGPLSQWTALPPGLLTWAGALLLPIAAYMAAVALWWPGSAPAVWLVVAGNLAWVFASMAVIGGAAPANIWGIAFVLAQALVVAVLALLEAGALRAGRRPATGLS